MSENIQRKIARLLERAAHPGTEEHERSACMAKADRLMAEYKVERSTISWEHEDKTREPVVVERPGQAMSSKMVVTTSKKDYVEYVIQGTVTGMRNTLYRFAGCRVREVYVRGVGSVLKVIGYEEDIYYADFLWNLTLSEVLKAMFPAWGGDLSDAGNIYTLKQAGFSWPQVRVMAMNNNAKVGGVLIDEKNAASKLRTAYRQHARVLGVSEEMPKLRDPSHWRHSYIAGFNSKLSQRCAALKQGRDEFFDGVPNQVALRKDSAQVDDLWEKTFGEADRLQDERIREHNEKHKNDKPRRSRAVATKSRDADMSAWRAGVISADKIQLSQSDSLKNKKEIG